MTAATLQQAIGKARFESLRRVNRSTLIMLVVAVLVFIGFGAATPTFFTMENMRNIAVQVAPEAIVGVAMTFVITCGMIDLSVGSILALVTVVGANLLKAGYQSTLVIVICLAIGAACGVVNGWFSGYQRIPSFIVTLATMSIVRGIALLITQGFSVAISSTLIFAKVGQGNLFSFGYPAWIALIVVIVGILGLQRMRFGQYVTGIGSNEESVRRAGVSTSRVKLLALTLCGLAAGAAGIITAGRLGSGDANTASDLALNVITAVVIGGTNLLGGKGSIIGTVIGAVLMGVITDGLTLLGLSPYIVPIVTGGLLIIVIWINLRGESIAEFLKRRVTQ
jgi:simple sugar transport system permease protein